MSSKSRWEPAHVELCRRMEQEQIGPAKLARKLGVTYETVRLYRIGEMTPSAPKQYAIEQLLGLPMQRWEETRERMTAAAAAAS